MPQGSDYFELADYVGVLRRKWAVIIAFTLVGVVLAGAYYYVAPRTYTATILVQVNALPTNANALGGRTGGPINMDNEGQIVQSATIASIAKAKLHSQLSLVDLVRKVHVTVPPNTTFLQISCDEPTAVQAQRCANAFGSAYLYNRRHSTLNLVTTGLKALYAQARQLERNIETLKVKIKSAPATGPDSKGVQQFQLQGKITRLNALTDKINSVAPLQANLSVKSTLVGSVVTPATRPTAPVSPAKKLILPSGLAGGLVLGLVLAFFWDWRRPRIHTPRDVARRVELPTVFNLVDAKGGAQTPFAPPRSRTGQAFTEIAQYVGTALGDGNHVLLVAGTAASTSGSSVAANLAGALARTRGETVLICADPHGLAIPKLLGAADGRGFAEVLAGTAAVGDVMRPTADLPLLRVITPGLDAAGAVYDMQHDKVQRLMRELRKQVRYVIIDVPSPDADADTFSLAEFADASIVIACAGTARPAEVIDCVQRLERMRTVVLAAVLLPNLKRSRRPRGRSASANDLPSYPPPAFPPALRQPEQRQLTQHQPEHRQPAHHHQAVQPAVKQAQVSQQTRQGQHSASEAPQGPPVIRPVAGRRTSISSPINSSPANGTSGSAGGSGGSRHAAPDKDSNATAVRAQSQAGSSDKSPSGSFSSAWTPRNVSETWPLPRTAITDEDEEAGISDPLIGN